MSNLAIAIAVRALDQFSGPAGKITGASGRLAKARSPRTREMNRARCSRTSTGDSVPSARGDELAHGVDLVGARGMRFNSEADFEIA
jgi:hypothetical protein